MDMANVLCLQHSQHEWFAGRATLTVFDDNVEQNVPKTWAWLPNGGTCWEVFIRGGEKRAIHISCLFCNREDDDGM